MKKILSLFVLLFSLLLIYFLFSNTTASNVNIVKKADCCVKICIYNQDGNYVNGCNISIVETGSSCTTVGNGCCEICGLEESTVYHYIPQCCEEINPIPSFTCRCGMTVEHHCTINQ